MARTSSIRIRRETQKRLAKLKEHPRETFDDVISRLIVAHRGTPDD